VNDYKYIASNPVPVISTRTRVRACVRVACVRACGARACVWRACVRPRLGEDEEQGAKRTNLDVANENFVVRRFVSEVREGLRGIAFVLAHVSKIVVVFAVGPFDKSFNSATTMNK
jgi:hypothetical protein